jgi:hypothetical protein
MINLVETFPALQNLGCIHGFTQRIPGLDVKASREIALERLDRAHAAVRAALGLGERRFITARQVHGRDVAVVAAGSPDRAENVDGLITASRDVCLGIYVADCCPVYLIDPVQKVIGLLHSGRKGSELEIATAAIARMQSEFQSEPAQIVAQLGPCIRPPHYEVDFAAQIVASCRAAGLTRIYDCGICTACRPDQYYSYRLEKGQTGRMLALLALG